MHSTARTAILLACLISSLLLRSTARPAQKESPGTKTRTSIEQTCRELAESVVARIVEGAEDQVVIAVAPLLCGGKRDRLLSAEMASRMALELEKAGKGKIRLAAMSDSGATEAKAQDLDSLKRMAAGAGAQVLVDARIVPGDERYEVLLRAYRISDSYLLAAAKSSLPKSKEMDRLLAAKGKPVAPPKKATPPAEAEDIADQGDACYASGDYKGALKHYLKIADTTNRAPVLFRTAYMLQTIKKDFPSAQRHYERFVSLEPAYAPAHNNLGNVLKTRGNTERAKTAYEEALRIDPDYATAQYNLALILHESGQDDEALKRYRAACKLDPELASAHNNQAEILLERNQLKEALAEFRKTVKIDPRNLNAWLRIIEISIADGRIEEARRDLKKALSDNPIQPRLLILSARLALCEEKVDDALVSYRKISDAFKATEESRCLHALALVRHGDMDKAEAQFKIASRTNQGRRLVLGTRWAMYVAQGKLDLATEELQSAMALEEPIPLSLWRKCLVEFLGADAQKAIASAEEALAKTKDAREKVLLECLVRQPPPAQAEGLSPADTCRYHLSLAAAAMRKGDKKKAGERLDKCLACLAPDTPAYVVALHLKSTLAAKDKDAGG